MKVYLLIYGGKTGREGGREELEVKSGRGSIFRLLTGYHEFRK